MFSKFDELCQKIIINSKKEMVKLQHPYVGTEHLLLSFLSFDNSISKLLNSYKINYKNFFDNVVDAIGYGDESNDWFIFTPLLKSVMENAMLEGKETGNNLVTSEILFLSLIEQGEGVAVRILSKMGLNLDKVYKSFANSIDDQKKYKTSSALLEKYGLNLNEEAKALKFDLVYGRNEEIENIINILLRRNKNNPLLIGDAGVGKTAIVEELANRIVNNNVPYKLRNKQIISLSMSVLVSGTKYRGEFEERINKIIKEAENNPNIILFIDEIHTLVGAGGAEGAIDASNILKPYLARGKLKLIGATTTSEYKKYIEKEKALNRRFQLVNIEEPSVDITCDILKKNKNLYEAFHNVVIDDEVIMELVNLTNKYIFNKKQPDKSLDILDEVCSKKSNMLNKTYSKVKLLENELKDIADNKNKYIIDSNFTKAMEYKNKQNILESKLNKLLLNDSKKHIVPKIEINDVVKVIENRSGIVVLEHKKSFDDNLYKKLSKEIIGQDNAIKKIVKFNNFIWRGLRDKNKPVSLLFVGGSGCGKTELVKKYNEFLFNKRKFIRLDMSEFKESHSVSKIIGAPAGYVGYNDNNNFLEEVRDNPFSIILLDEIEKAHKDVINLFLQILDNGKIKSSSGNEIMFNNTIIIMTSNLGCNNKTVGFIGNNNIINSKVKEFFSVEFLNRVDDIIVFNSLNKKDIELIVKSKLNMILKNVAVEHKSVDLKKILMNVIDNSNYEIYGARKIEKILYEEVNNLLFENSCIT